MRNYKYFCSVRPGYAYLRYTVQDLTTKELYELAEEAPLVAKETQKSHAEEVREGIKQTEEFLVRQRALLSVLEEGSDD